MIIRQNYLDKIEKYLGKEYIIVLVGQRRIGKSFWERLIFGSEKISGATVAPEISIYNNVRVHNYIYLFTYFLPFLITKPLALAFTR